MGKLIWDGRSFQEQAMKTMSNEDVSLSDGRITEKETAFFAGISSSPEHQH
jgi:hypothetical protein